MMARRRRIFVNCGEIREGDRYRSKQKLDAIKHLPSGQIRPDLTYKIAKT
jgi:hypothetical protein